MWHNRESSKEFFSLQSARALFSNKSDTTTNAILCTRFSNLLGSNSISAINTIKGNYWIFISLACVSSETHNLQAVLLLRI